MQNSAVIANAVELRRVTHTDVADKPERIALLLRGQAMTINH